MRLPSPHTALTGLTAVAALAALAACGTQTNAAAPAAARAAVPSTPPVPGISQFKSSESPKSLLDFWTPQRLAAATPKPLPNASEQAGKPGYSADAAGPGLSGAPELPTLGGTAGNALDAQAKAAQGDNAWVWKRHGVAPARTVGLLAFIGADGKQYSCSGTVITSKNRSTVWTAGHCVYERGWDQKAVFVPDFHDGQTPLGVWPVVSFHTTKQWTTQTNPNYDIAAVQVAPKNGHHLQDYTGSQGFNFNYTSRSFPIIDFGYPGDLLPSGQSVDFRQLRYCTGTTYPINLGFAGPLELSLHCTMGHGASGGPWLTGVGRNGLGYLIGTNSTHSLKHDDMHAAFEGKGSVAVGLYKASAN